MPQVLVHCYCTPVLAELQSQIWNPEPSQEQKVSGDSVFLFFWGRAGFRGPHVNPKNNPVKPKVLTGRVYVYRFSVFKLRAGRPTASRYHLIHCPPSKRGRGCCFCCFYMICSETPSCRDSRFRAFRALGFKIQLIRMQHPTQLPIAPQVKSPFCDACKCIEGKRRAALKFPKTATCES